MGYQLVDDDPDPAAVRRLTFVAFLPDQRCLAVSAEPDGLRLPSGAVEDGEHWLLDTCLRVPVAAANFRMQRARPFAADGDHLYVWLDGDWYRDGQPAAAGAVVAGVPAQIADQLAQAGRPDQARAVRDAARAFGNQSDADYYAGNLRLLEAAYLRGTTPQQGSGFGGDATRWRARRELIVDGIDRDGTFLDVGCANGLLMESVQRWAAERGYHIEPYGVDLAPGLVALARDRLPQWADRISLGNAIDYRPSTGRRFTYVHTLLDLVPAQRRGDMLRHALEVLVEPGGRLLVSHYQPAGGTEPSAADQVRALGFTVAGESHAAGADRTATTGWVDT